MEYHFSRDFAVRQDSNDPLAHFRSKFHVPASQQEHIYLCGNSLGLQPKATESYIQEELEVWKKLGVEGHFKGKNPWVGYHKLTREPISKIVGGKYNEVVSKGSLTSNLHNLLVSFYQPSATRSKIITDYKNFPSDAYALESQVRFRGLDPDQTIIEIVPQKGTELVTTEDILQCIEAHSQDLALVMMSGVHYYTGQFFDLQKITAAAHRAGAFAGFDLAHAVGNVPLHLHEWNVDFAAWCSYKYLNSGPGGIGGIFVHEQHGKNLQLNRFAGWWGHREEERFLMEKGFRPMEGAEGWQQSNINVISAAAHRAALDLFEEAGMDNLRQKSIKLTGYLEYIIHQINEGRNTKTIEIITPSDIGQRGCQLSLIIEKEGKRVFDYITEKGVIADWREPSVLRVAPVPLYNSFSDVYMFGKILEEAVEQIKS